MEHDDRERRDWPPQDAEAPAGEPIDAITSDEPTPDEATKPVEWTEDTTAEAIRRLVRRLQRLGPGEVRACYEAGPTGYGLQRLLGVEGVICEVVAPSLTPVKPARGSRRTDGTRASWASCSVPGC